jgi:hypothetical protein
MRRLLVAVAVAASITTLAHTPLAHADTGSTICDELRRDQTIYGPSRVAVDVMRSYINSGQFIDSVTAQAIVKREAAQKCPDQLARPGWLQ